MSSSTPRSVKIGENERSGWSSERPRKPGEPERPPRQADVSVRGRVLSPGDRMRYSPGSLVLVASPDAATRDAFLARVLEDQNVLLSQSKIRGMLQGRVEEDELEEKTQALLDGAAAKRLGAGQTVVVGLETLEPGEREHYVRLAAPHRRPRHFVLVEVGKDRIEEGDRVAMDEVRRSLEAGELGQEGFVTSLRLGGRTVEELKRIVFAPPPADD
jgi:predicted kinase